MTRKSENNVPAVEIEEEAFHNPEQTSQYLATDDGRRGIILDSWMDNGCMPDDLEPLEDEIMNVTADETNTILKSVAND